MMFFYEEIQAIPCLVSAHIFDMASPRFNQLLYILISDYSLKEQKAVPHY